MDNQEKEGIQKTKIKEQMGSETGSSIIPILNQLEHAWTYKTPRG
jgi:hypothetical protein